MKYDFLVTQPTRKRWSFQIGSFILLQVVRMDAFWSYISLIFTDRHRPMIILTNSLAFDHSYARPPTHSLTQPLATVLFLFFFIFFFCYSFVCAWTIKRRLVRINATNTTIDKAIVVNTIYYALLATDWFFFLFFFLSFCFFLFTESRYAASIGKIEC